MVNAFKKTALSVSTVCAIVSSNFIMAENRIDNQRPDAPILSAYGSHTVGVRTITLVHKNQIDILSIDGSVAKPNLWPRYDRPLVSEVWYPAQSNASGSNDLNAFIRDGKTEVILKGRANRNAPPITADEPYPLIVISHGHPGNRYLMSHLAENLASKGYVVIALDHTDSTYRDPVAFGSTLYNRRLDQLFAIDEVERLNTEEDHFLYGLVDASQTGLIGYSMGAYGAVIAAGGGLTQTSIDYSWGTPHGLLGDYKSGSKSHLDLLDDRIKTAIAIAPWGMNYGFWDANGLQEIDIPMLFVAGSEDETSGYENGTRAIWQAASNTDRSLLTFDNASHNAAAPYPAPTEGREFDEDIGFAPYEHYADAVWNTSKMNNVLQHFASVWMGKHLKEDQSMAPYLDLIPTGNEGVWSKETDGTPNTEHTHWRGFKQLSAKGLRYETLGPNQ
jgi:predicted dienelactone hydrolase